MLAEMPLLLAFSHRPGTMRIRLRKRKPIRATWLGRPFLNKVNGDRFSIHQQETTLLDNQKAAFWRRLIGLMVIIA
jgi:hypothetical protein